MILIMIFYKIHIHFHLQVLTNPLLQQVQALHCLLTLHYSKIKEKPGLMGTGVSEWTNKNLIKMMTALMMATIVMLTQCLRKVATELNFLTKVFLYHLRLTILIKLFIVVIILCDKIGFMDDISTSHFLDMGIMSLHVYNLILT